MRLGTVATLVLASLLPAVAFAQFAGTAGGVSGAPFSVSVDPTYPAPYGQATLSFLSDSLDLTNATLTVSVGGKQIYSGSVRPVSLTLGKGGSVTRATVRITSNGGSYSGSVVIQPQDVSLIAESISSAPPLYPGKPLPPVEGDVRVVAVANLVNAQGVALDPAKLSYTWTVDATEILNASGIGKEALMVASPLQYRSRDVSVLVKSQDGSVVGGDTLSLSPVEPTVRVYENDPLLGIRFDRALSGTFSISGAESTLYAAPFSFATGGGGPVITWFLNGEAAQRGSGITLRPTGSGQGSASLTVTALGASDITAQQDFSILFGTNSGSNFFGL